MVKEKIHLHCSYLYEDSKQKLQSKITCDNPVNLLKNTRIFSVRRYGRVSTRMLY